MGDAIYFTKVEFVEGFEIKNGFERHVILLNIPEQELSY